MNGWERGRDEKINQEDGDSSMVEQSDSNLDILGLNLGCAHFDLKRAHTTNHSIFSIWNSIRELDEY